MAQLEAKGPHGRLERPDHLAALTAGVFTLALFTAIGFHFAYQSNETATFELGSMDRDYLLHKEEFHPRLRMNGPIRHEDGRVEVIEFYGRLSRTRATLRLPYHAHRSPLEMTIRSHRFGLLGSVGVKVNGEQLDTFVFGETSYPWAGMRGVIPQSVAERGPLTIELTTEGGKTPGSTLPEDLGVGIDWVRITPLSKGIRLRPSPGQYAFAAAFPIAALLFVFVLWRRLYPSLICGIIATLAVLAWTFWDPFVASMAIGRLWIVFPLGLLLYGALRRIGGAVSGVRLVARALSVAFVLTVLAHSLLIFAPNHAPPDLWNHLPQVEWLQSLEMSLDELYRFSTSSDPFDDGHTRPHFGVDYGAPYPPFFYLLAYLTSLVHDDARFLVEFLSVIIGGLFVVLIYLISNALGFDRKTSAFAAGLSILEISIWHHAHRVHSPGSLGELALLCWLLVLIVYHQRLDERRVRGGFALLTALTALAYAATLVQMSLFLVLLVGLLLAQEGLGSRMARSIIISTGIGFAIAFVCYYAPYALAALQKSNVLLSREAYDPPASFLFLRNQMRDTVRILRNGYPLYVLLSLVGVAVLVKGVDSIQRPPDRFRRQIPLLGLLTYVLMLLLKDPSLFPMIFLHAKEDLFYAPFACILAGLSLSWLATKPGGKWAVMAVFASFLVLALRDQAQNFDTLRDPRVGMTRSDPEEIRATLVRV